MLNFFRGTVRFSGIIVSYSSRKVPKNFTNPNTAHSQGTCAFCTGLQERFLSLKPKAICHRERRVYGETRFKRVQAMLTQNNSFSLIWFKNSPYAVLGKLGA
jgi:hypothetical protein